MTERVHPVPHLRTHVEESGIPPRCIVAVVKAYLYAGPPPRDRASRSALPYTFLWDFVPSRKLRPSPACIYPWTHTTLRRSLQMRVWRGCRAAEETYPRSGPSLH